MSPTRTSAVVLFLSFWLDDCSLMYTSLEMGCLHSAQWSETGCCTYLFFVIIYFFSAVYNNHSVTLGTCFSHHLKHSWFFTFQSAHKLNWMSSRCRALVYIAKHAFYCPSVQPSLKGSPATVRIKLPLHIKHKCYSSRNHATHSRVLSTPYLALPRNEMLYSTIYMCSHDDGMSRYPKVAHLVHRVFRHLFIRIVVLVAGASISDKEKV